MKQLIAAVLAAAVLVVIPVSVVSAAPAKQSCVRLSLPNQTVCSPNALCIGRWARSSSRSSRWFGTSPVPKTGDRRYASGA
jgi:hypothetical protein